MTRLPHDDQPLIQFLKQNRPIPPATTNLVEKQLMQWVVKERRVSSSKPIFYRLLIPGMIATAGLVTWHFWKSGPSTQQMATQPEELESFVIDSWNGANEQLSYAPKETNLENTWLMLEESDSNSKNKTNHK
ncbi:hypothetical protein [Chroococcus sp. FPU101]|uniref:hypothetical protein n=1 Tax=Chroococcus sp. FPU101 TaxID=1974212 RepID=UPI001A8EFA25|nr:hypothetical protein [Chroococcus sp. FPU101]GFE70405.1 hypothetical protein CFPU101_30150 [Chroococcus sp. FPU101]